MRENIPEGELAMSIVQSKKKDSVQSLSDQPRDVDNPDIIAYTTGCVEIKPDDKKAYAKKEGIKYYLKSNGGILYDPHGLYDTYLYKRVGDQSIWSWQQVGVRAFEFYIGYLKTKNKSHYRNASREIM